MSSEMTRRDFLKTAAQMVVRGMFVTSFDAFLPAPACPKPNRSQSDLTNSRPCNRYDLEIGYEPMELKGQIEPIEATAINGSVPGPPVHLKEGQTVNLNVTNALWDSKHTSIHWHGILVPPEMDGVPGISYN